MFRLALHWQILAGMLVGAAIGLTLNLSVGDREASVPQSQLPEGIDSVSFHDTTNRIDIHITDREGTARHVVVDGTRQHPGSLVTLEQLAEHDPQAFELFRAHGRSRARRIGDAAQRLGNLFLRLLKMVAIPLIVSSLSTGVMALGHAGRLGRMFGRTVLYYVCTSLLAIATGLLMVNLIRPGMREEVSGPSQAATNVSDHLGGVLFNQLETVIPPNPFAALATSNFLAIISFTLAFSIFAILVGGRTLKQMSDLASAAFDVMMAMTMAVIKLAPWGVLFLMLFVTATQGPDIFRSLFWYMLTVVCALAFHALVVLPLILHFVARRNPLHFAQAMTPALLTAFSSASSNGTLPLTLSSVEKRAGISNRVSSFVLPLGATVNMDGTALYEAVAVLFIAQLHPDFDLGFSQQIVVAFTALLASIGAAGIPHAGLVMMIVILQAVGLPVEMQGIIIAVDRVLDMFRTSVNVWSDSCGCAVIARFEADGHAEAEESHMEA